MGGDEEFIEKASRYFGGATMTEARRLTMPEEELGDDDAGDQGDDGAGDGDSGSSDGEV